MATFVSSRASGAPMQWCAPQPKLKGTLSFVHCRYTLVLSPRAYISVNVAGVGRRRTSELGKPLISWFNNALEAKK